MNHITIKNLERITKKTAEKLYNSGEFVYICAHKINPIGTIGACRIDKNSGKTFKQIINEFIFYNCTHETGYYPAYYKKI